MGWFWGGKGSNDDDPTKSLDPSLQDFLKSQQPRPYAPAAAPSPPPPSNPQTDSNPDPTQNPASPNTNAKASEDRPVPSESLFPDGRYAHLWTTYTPQSTLIARSTTPLERFVSARKDRSDLLNRAALENCAFEQELQQNCFYPGSGSSSRPAGQGPTDHVPRRDQGLQPVLRAAEPVPAGARVPVARRLDRRRGGEDPDARRHAVPSDDGLRGRRRRRPTQSHPDPAADFGL
jgi:hypothetical protein